MQSFSMVVYTEKPQTPSGQSWNILLSSSQLVLSFDRWIYLKLVVPSKLSSGSFVLQWVYDSHFGAKIAGEVPPNKQCVSDRDEPKRKLPVGNKRVRANAESRCRCHGTPCATLVTTSCTRTYTNAIFCARVGFAVVSVGHLTHECIFPGCKNLVCSWRALIQCKLNCTWKNGIIIPWTIEHGYHIHAKWKDRNRKICPTKNRSNRIQCVSASPQPPPFWCASKYIVMQPIALTELEARVKHFQLHFQLHRDREQNRS